MIHDSNPIFCRVCQTEVIPFFSLGNMPLVNSFLEKNEISQEKMYPLTVAFCPHCYLAQLTEIAPPEALFSDYIYFSSTSTSFLEHCKYTAETLTSRLGLTSQNLVLEIASNDGAQLQFFKALGIKILGVDPAKNIAEIANQRGLPTIPTFFNAALAKKLHDEDQTEADLIFGANVLAHVPDIVDFVKGVKTLLRPKGTAVFEFPYLKGLMENKFDTIYHEHVFYYSLLALIYLFKTAELEIYDVEMMPVQGGSLRIFISHPGVFPTSKNVNDLVEQEKKEGFDTIQTYQKINTHVNTLKTELIALLKQLRKEGKKIAAYSAPAKGNILLNYFDLKGELDFLVDKSKAKQGLYTPGTHFLVHALDKIDQEKPDYLLVLCWNIADEIIHMPELEAYRKRGGKFIVPIPEVRII